ncbi:hypothetical protein FQR65_LT07704 [Abscondita terminalis]|nr:hypothetical protein FQR65_LT07704 [Abscondita terminalis]
MFDVKGKVALVTGGASGIGLACVKEFLKNGMKGVTFVDINEELGLKVCEEVKKEYGDDKVLFLKVDVTDKIQFEDAFKKTIEKFKNIDVLINNAGMFDERNWEKTVAVNLNSQIIGSLLGVETYIPKYRSGSIGVIVNVCSIASVDVTEFGPVYTATKWGALGISRVLGLENHFERTKVKVIAICPGSTTTPIIKSLDDFTMNEHYAKFWKKYRPNMIMQTPEHVAASVVNLMENANTGSVWVIEFTEPPQELEFPTREQMKKKAK